MKQIVTIAAKELKDYFVSPIAYIVIALFLIVTGWFFFSTFFFFGRADLRDFFSLLPMIFSFFIPAVTMRLLAEEKSMGSHEILLTMPVSPGDILMGKFLAAVLFTCLMVLPTLSYPICISFTGQLDPGPVAGGYLGVIGLACTYCAMGLFASALTRSQIVAFIIGCALCFVFTIIDRMLFFMPEQMIALLEYMGINFHFTNISKGVIDSRDILYFISATFIFLFSTKIIMQENN